MFGRKGRSRCAIFLMLLCAGVLAATPRVALADSYQNMYRMYNPSSGEHFYTADLNEAKYIASVGWRWEGIGWVAPVQGDEVYRLYNPNAGDHHYTTSAFERDYLKSVGWNYEGVGWHSASAGEGVPVYRQYNPNQATGTHNFTTSKEENDYLASIGWHAEGIAWYAANRSPAKINGFWLVTSAWGSEERYWIDENASVAKSRLVRPSEGSGYLAYATSSGAVVRGVSDAGNGLAWVADNDGRLLTGSGWVVTGEFDNGTLQRYYAVNQGEYALARTGYFSVDGSRYYGIPSKGYVARGQYWLGDGTYITADNDGRITGSGKIAIRRRMYSSLDHGPKTAANQRYIVLHDTEGTGSGANVIDWWASNGNLVAAHFVVDRDGTIWQCVELDRIAHHAGYGDTGHNAKYGITEDGRDDMRGVSPVGSWASDYAMNAWSIGIELVHVGGGAPYTEAQLNSLDNLIAYIDGYYGFESTIIDHKAWRSGNSDTSSEFSGYLANYQRTRRHNG